MFVQHFVQILISELKELKVCSGRAPVSFRPYRSSRGSPLDRIDLQEDLEGSPLKMAQQSEKTPTDQQRVMAVRESQSAPGSS
jgi:hypothetical protein